jgi:phage baseplate assembly protein W
MAKNTRNFSDIDLTFIANPVTGDLSKKYDENAVKQSIKNLVMTRNYERPFNSSIGSQIYNVLFEPISNITPNLVKQIIQNTINTFEPRAKLIDISVLLTPDSNSLYVTIVFAIINTVTPITMSLTLERTR